MTRDEVRQKLQAYQNRIADTKRQETERLQRRKEGVVRFQELIQTAIRPAMEKFAKEMGNEVCHFRIDGDFANQHTPQIRFWITPTGVRLNEYEFGDVPHIFYQFDPKVLAVTTDISTIVKGKAGCIYHGRTYQLDEITPEAIENDLTEVLGELMDNLLSG